VSHFILFHSRCLYLLLIGFTLIFDQYLIFLLPLGLILIFTWRGSKVPVMSKWLVCVMAIFIILSGLYALGGTHDYFSWNRARWSAIQRLMNRDQIPYSHIDGGYEVNGWHNYNPHYRKVPTKSWWWVNRDDYVIAFGEINGYRPIRYYPYKRWIPSGQGFIMILKKSNLNLFDQEEE